MKEFIENYRKGIGLLNYATSGLSTEDLLKTPGPGDWNTNQVVLHITDTELLFTERMKRVLTEKEPSLIKADESEWAKKFFYSEQSAGESAVLFDLNRKSTVFILDRLEDSEFEKIGIHSSRGPQTLRQIVELCSTHLDSHLKFIYEKRARMGRPITEKYSRTNA